MREAKGANLAGHPIHPMLIVFPLGLLATAFVFDMVAFFLKVSGIAMAAYWMIAAGIVGGLAAAVFGLWDWLAIPRRTRAKRIGIWHALGNVVVLFLFAASWWVRRIDPVNPGESALLLSLVGTLLAVVTGWLGGELVYRLGIAVDKGAHPNATSSLAASRAGGSGAYPYPSASHTVRS